MYIYLYNIYKAVGRCIVESVFCRGTEKCRNICNTIFYYIYIYIYIQDVPGGMCQTLGECSLGHTIPI